MSNMNGVTRRKKYQEIVERDGEYCKCCGKLASEGQLVVDHRDNNNTNNSHTNLQLLCRSCNYLKNPRKSPLDMCESENSQQYSEESSMSKNRRTEPLFREFILSELANSECNSLTWDEAINMGAEKIGISQMTAERYLNKMISKYGALRLLSAYEHKIILRKSDESMKESQPPFEW